MQRIGKSCGLRGLGLLIVCVVLVTLLPAGVRATSLCVQVENNGFLWRSIPAILDSEVRLNFHHSIYGSRVEEVFRLRSGVFDLTELRYAEQRLVEFYGYEDADYANGMWVVRPRLALIRSLNLRTSSAVSLLFEHHTQRIQLTLPTDSALRLTVAACKVARNG